MRTRKLTESESIAEFADGLQTLKQLVGVYDTGHTPITSLMAVEVQKLLTEYKSAIKLRGTIKFYGPKDYFDHSILNIVNKLVLARIDSSIVTCIPFSYKNDKETLAPMEFRHWWNRDAIYIASAAPDGSLPGLIPVNGSPDVAFEKRERLTRRKLVEMIRNKKGAHHASEFPTIIDELQNFKYLYSIRIEEDGGRILSTDDGTLPVNVGPLAPMMRQIAHELLISYGIDDFPPDPEIGSSTGSMYVGQPVFARNPPPYGNPQ